MAGGDVLRTRHVLQPAVGSGLGMSLMKRLAWQTAAGRCWISRDISSRWPCDIEDSPRVAFGWDDSFLLVGPVWLCQSSAPACLGVGWGQSIPLPAGYGRGFQASSGAGSATLQPGCGSSEASHSIVPQPAKLGNPGIFSFLVMLHRCWHPQAGGSGLCQSHRGWPAAGQHRVVSLAPCSRRFTAPGEGGWGQVPRRCHGSRRWGKPCLAQGWPGSIWHSPSLTARCLEPGVW